MEPGTVTPPPGTETVTPPVEPGTVTPPVEPGTVTPPVGTETVTPPVEPGTVTPPPGTETVTPPPVITGTIPGTATSAEITVIEIIGNNFQEEGLQIFLQKFKQSISGIIISATTTTIVATFDLRNQALGKRDIVVENLDHQRGTLTDGFEIVAPSNATIKILCNKDNSFVFWGPNYKGKIFGGELIFPVTPPEKNKLEVYSPDFQQQYIEEVTVEEIREKIITVIF